jgi:NAD(P)-dependent dehydrogenase (short-subunit alcohol dehydrogenase family)
MTNLSGKIICMTGATSGLGRVAAKHFALQGAHLILICRNLEKGKSLQEEVGGKGKVDLIQANLNSFDTIVKACEEIRKQYDHIDILINNAGIMNFSFKETADGIEESLQVNFLSPLLIAHLLSPLLEKAAAPKFIFTSSALHQGNIYFEDLEFRKDFSSYKSYRHGKLGLILVCRLLAEKWGNKPLGIYTQHPGMVRTNLGRDAGWFSKAIFWMMGTSPEKGAQNLIFLTETPAEKLESGAYYAKFKPVKTTPESYDMEVAGQLLERARAYLAPFLKQASVIFEGILTT